MIFTGRSDPRTHTRYIERTAGLNQVPEVTQPDFGTRFATACGNSLEQISKKLARHTGFEPVAYGFGGGFLQQNSESSRGDESLCVDHDDASKTRRSTLRGNDSAGLGSADSPLRSTAERVREDATADLIEEGLGLAIRMARNPAGWFELERVLGHAARLVMAEASDE